MITSTSISALKQGGHFFYEKFLAPRSTTEDDRRREFILNIILTASIIFLVFFDCLVLYSSVTQDPYTGISFQAFSGIVILFVGLYILSRKGFFIASSFLLTLVYLVSITYACIEWGPGLPDALLSFAMLIVISSVLISTRFSFLILIITAIILNILGYRYGWKPISFNQDDPIKYSVLLMVITVVSWLSNRETERSLVRARGSEKSLKQERDLLEVKVEERTHELRKAQVEKVSQLYRFAEFGRLSTGIFHDLMNPLSIIASNVSELEHSSIDIPDMQDHIGRAIGASKKMESFIGAIKKQMRSDELNDFFTLNAEIEEVLALLKYKAIKTRVFLEFHAEQKLKTYGNPLKFQQIVMNLVSNAIDAYEGSTLPEEKKIVSVTLHKKNNTFQLVVIDCGCGISEKVISKIFDPFFTTKSEHKGMGIGLSSTKDIVEKNFGGTIKIKTKEHEGSAFMVTIPFSHLPHSSRTSPHQK